jgi:putative DNA methylase
MPLVSNFWLGKKKGKEAWIRPIVEGKKIRFEIGHGQSGPPPSPKVGRGARFRCLVCDNPAPESYTHREIDEGRSGTQLMAVVAAGDRQRTYLAPSELHAEAAHVERPNDVPTAPARGTFGGNAQGQRYGFKTFADYFTNRQLMALCTLSDLVEEARERVQSDSRDAGNALEQAKQYADDVATYLGFVVSRMADYVCSLAGWVNAPNMEIIGHLFTRQAIPMVWDFAEANVLEPFTGSVQIMVRAIANTIDRLPAAGSAHVLQADARGRNYDGLVVVTDPPYYDNIGYADLSDFFYVWLRKALRSIYPNLLGTVLTPKSEELVVAPQRFDGDARKAQEFFEDGFVSTFAEISAHGAKGFPVTLFYAFRQSEQDSSDGHVSTGWETLLHGLLSSGLSVVGTWPVRTEKSGRMLAMGTNALASSIVLVCRPRAETAGITDRSEFLKALRVELPNELKLLQQAAIAPVDLAQASIGPGMAVFSRYAKVIEPSGEPMRVRTALGLINQVLAEVLEAAEGELDPPTRWAIKWFEQRGFDEGPFGEAEVLATATGVAVDGLVRDGIARSRAGKVRLLDRDELPNDWDPVADERLSVWEATQHLVKALDEGGESAAASLLESLGGVGDAAQALAYRLYSLCERKGWAKEAGPYNALAAVWGSLRSMASADAVAQDVTQGTLL